MQNRRGKTVVIARLIWYSITAGKSRDVVRDCDQQMFVDGSEKRGGRVCVRQYCEGRFLF